MVRRCEWLLSVGILEPLVDIWAKLTDFLAASV